jgi:N-acetylmuramoyl-L-alanine amidase
MPRTPALPTDSLIPDTPKRRTVLKAGGTLLLSVLAPMLPLPAMAAQIMAVRVWPADEYTRITLENDGDLKVSHLMLANPPRLVVDIDGLALNETLKSLVAKVESNDPYIKQVRVAQNRPNVVRLVFDLKEDVKPQVFNLEPVAGYRHRLIFDLYPTAASRPPRRRRRRNRATPRSARPAPMRSPSWKPTPPAQAAPRPSRSRPRRSRRRSLHLSLPRSRHRRAGPRCCVW